MAKRKRSAPEEKADQSAPQSRSASDGIEYSNLSLHELFQQQARTLLDRTDLDDEQKQHILVAMSCPCCGAGGLSFTAKIKRRS